MERSLKVVFKNGLHDILDRMNQAVCRYYLYVCKCITKSLKLTNINVNSSYVWNRMDLTVEGRKKL